MLALKQDRVRQRGGRCRTKREGQQDMKTKRETERRACGEMVEIDCSTGLQHKDFIYCVPTSPTLT